MRILFIEDDQKIADNVAEFLRSAGHTVDLYNNGSAGYAATTGSVKYDCIITDLMLPGMDGVAIIRKNRSDGLKTPVLVLTAKGELPDRIEGLDSGADDYLPKPFSLRELESRMRAIVRRSTRNNDSDGFLKVGPLTLDILSRRANREGQEFILSKKHFQLLELLMRNAGRPVSKGEIEQALYGENSNFWSDVIRSHVQMLRKRIDIPFTERLIHSTRGMGYVIEQR